MSLLVLGTCPLVAPVVTKPVTITPKAVAENGYLRTAGLSSLLPDSIRCELKYLPTTGDRSLGYWRVEGGESRKVRVTELLELPPEIVSIEILSTDTDLVRQMLLEDGIVVPFNLERRKILLRFGDGRLAGPVFFEKIGTTDRYRCFPTSLQRPLPSWPSLDHLRPATVSIQKAERQFVAWPLPPAPGLLDLTPLETVLRTLLEIGTDTGPGTALLTEGQRELLIERLKQVPDHRVPAAHRERLQKVLEESLQTSKHLDVWWNTLVAHPGIHNRLLEWKQQAVEKEKPRWEQEYEDLRVTIDRLRSEKDRLEGQLRKLREEGEQLPEELKRRARHAKDDLVAIVAEVRDHLVSPSGTATPFHIRSHSGAVTALSTLDSAYKVLSKNLTAAGLLPAAVKGVAREILVSLTLGQALLFRGSLAGLLAEVVVRSLAAPRWMLFDVPIGLADPAVLRSGIEAALPTGCSSFVGLWLDGANRSDLEAYGADLLRILGERAVGVPHADRRLLVVGTLGGGPAALPASPTLAALGPTVDTDLLDWVTRPGTAGIELGQLTAGVTPPKEGGDQEELKKWLDSCPFQPNQLWRRNVLAAFRRLAGWPSDGVEPMHSLVPAWILPYGQALGVEWNGEAGAALVDLLGVEEEWPARLRRHLKGVGLHE